MTPPHPIAREGESGQRLPFGEHPSRVYVAFTGTQVGLSEAQYGGLNRLLGRLREVGIVWMRNGDCIGADEEAGSCWQGKGGMLHLHPGTTASKRARQRGDQEETPRQNIERNHRMVDGAHMLVATPETFAEQLRSGTWATIRYARKHRRPLSIVWPNGAISNENYPTTPPSSCVRDRA